MTRSPLSEHLVQNTNEAACFENAGQVWNKKNNKHLADQPIDFSWYLSLPDHSIKDIKLIPENSANESRTVFFIFIIKGKAH